MILAVGDQSRTGRVVHLERSLDPERVARAVRTGRAGGSPPVLVHARTPASVHERVGCIRRDMRVTVRTALAAAGRARGLRTGADPEIRRLQRRLAAFDPPASPPDEGSATPEDPAALREAVATLRGRLTARRAHDLPTDAIEAELAETVSELAATETAAIAAEQARETRRREARRERDRLADRLRVEDRLANARRRARAALVDRLRGAYETAVAAVPGADPGDPFDADGVTASLAVARVARLAAPVVVSVDRFSDPRSASAWLGAPVIRLDFR